MSYISVGKPLFSDLACLQQAAEMLGCRLVKRNTYRWYGRSVGDYPLPAGMKASDLGKNAAYVIELNEETKARVRKNHGEEPYDVGLVEDPANPGTYLPMYDHFCGGYGVDEVMGAPIFDPKDYRIVDTMLPKLVQYYHMCCDAAAAREVGDTIDLLTLKDACQKYPHLFNEPSTDEATWVSVTDTTSRLGVA